MACAWFTVCTSLQRRRLVPPSQRGFAFRICNVKLAQPRNSPTACFGIGFGIGIGVGIGIGICIWKSPRLCILFGQTCAQLTWTLLPPEVIFCPHTGDISTASGLQLTTRRQPAVHSDSWLGCARVQLQYPACFR